MKKENKLKKREEEKQMRDKQFKRQGNICLGVVLGCAVLMFFVGQTNAGAPWLGGFFIAVGVVMAAAFFYSLRNVTRRLREMREEDGQ